MAATHDPIPATAATLMGRRTRPRRRSGHWGAEVLLVCADRHLLGARKAEIELHGHRVATAADPHLAVNLLLALRPEVVVLDVSETVREQGAHGRLRRHTTAAGIPLLLLGIADIDGPAPEPLGRRIGRLLR